MKAEWISIKEKLPEKEDDYLVYGEWDNVSKAHYCNGTIKERSFQGGSKDITKWITHWMPLPAPPKD